MSTLEVLVLLPRGTDKGYQDLAVETATISYKDIYVIKVLCFSPFAKMLSSPVEAYDTRTRSCSINTERQVIVVLEALHTPITYLVRYHSG
jgi:hypothetical protein